ncbi:NPCBM/NEW2 domain-containing protein [Verrucomicrobiota bacterium]
MSMLKYFIILFVAIAVTVCKAEIPIGALVPWERSESPSLSSDATPESSTIKPESSTIKVPPLRLAIDLVDGSRVIGVPRIKSIPVQSSYAKMDIPLKQIVSIKFHDDHETASIDLQNGDKLKGVLEDLQPLALETIFGKVSIGIEHVQGFRIKTRTGISLLGNAPTKVDASVGSDYYATSRTHDPTKHRILGLMDPRAGKVVQQFDEWIFLHSTSATKAASVLYEFAVPVLKFNGTIQTVSKHGKVKYAIYADGKLVYDTVLHAAQGPRQISVSLDKCRSLKLEVGSAGEQDGSWGVWGDPRIDK